MLVSDYLHMKRQPVLRRGTALKMHSALIPDDEVMSILHHSIRAAFWGLTVSESELLHETEVHM